MAESFEFRLRRQISEMEGRQVKMQAELARLVGHIQGLRQALDLFRKPGVQELNNAIVEHTIEQAMGRRLPDPKKSPAWASTLSALESAPPAGISVDDMEERLEKAGLSMARNTLLANLSVASKSGVVERVRVGHYRRRSPTVGELMMAVEQPGVREESEEARQDDDLAEAEHP